VPRSTPLRLSEMTKFHSVVRMPIPQSNQRMKRVAGPFKNFTNIILSFAIEVYDISSRTCARQTSMQNQTEEIWLTDTRPTDVPLIVNREDYFAPTNSRAANRDLAKSINVG
jgi:hypothetical protein